MTKTIFISHVSEDKNRLKQYTDRLLTEGFQLWIDSPEEICQSYREHPHVGRIDLGADWRVAIGAGIDHSDCVLAFWSKNAVEKDKARKADIFLWEIDLGRKAHKCLQVYLDPKHDTDVRPPFANDQMDDVSQLGLTGNEAAFNSTVSAIKAGRFPADSKAASAPRDLLPYLANRDAPTIQVSAEVRERLRFDASSDPLRAANSKIFVIPATLEDAPDMFVHRLCCKDGPEECGQGASRTTPMWTKVDLIWPDQPKLSTLRSELLIKDRIFSALDQYSVEGKPICFYSIVALAKLEKRPGDVICEWTCAVDDILDDWWKAARIQQEHQLLLAPSVFVLVVSMGKKQDLVRKFLWLPSRVEKRCREIESLNSTLPEKLATLKRVKVVSLARLSDILAEHAMRWSIRSELVAHDLHIKASEFVGRVFADDSLKLTMKDFVRHWHEETQVKILGG